MRKTSWIVVLVAVVVCAAIAWLILRRNAARIERTLYGNVDLRQVALAFNGSERIAAVLVEEGDRVQKGQLLAELDTHRLAAQLAQAQGELAAQQQALLRLKNGSRPEEIAEAQGRVAAQQQALLRLKNGSRPEEIAQARASVEAAQADAANARANGLRVKDLLSSGASTQQDADNAKAAQDVAEAKLVISQKALDLALIGPRKEDIDQAEAELSVSQEALDLAVLGPRKEDVDQAQALVEAREGQLAFAQQQLNDARLLSPTAGVIRTRVMEPGEMASPQRPVFEIAVTDPKWVRAYLSEPDLGKVHPGAPATVMVDSFPDRRFEGWVGFISPVAEFTPKPIQTEQLRTSLVYELRVFVKDPADDLRLGQPVTVRLDLGRQGAKTPPASPAGVSTTAPPEAKR
jgi:HlyD family secretion protein